MNYHDVEREVALAQITALKRRDRLEQKKLQRIDRLYLAAALFAIVWGAAVTFYGDRLIQYADRTLRFFGI